MIDAIACKQCHVALPPEAYWANKNTKSGLWAKCKKCVQAHRKTLYVPMEKEVVPAGMKRCSTCKKMRIRQDFYQRSDTTDKLCYTCKPCTRKKDRNRNQAGQEFNDRRRAVMRSGHLSRNFGITQEQYDEMFDRQLGLCAICKKPETMRRGNRVINLGIDHCHDTGKIRGLLCKACNRAIGQLGDSADRIRAALEYLESAERAGGI